MSDLGIRVENGRHVIEKWDRVFKALSAEPRRQLIVSLMNTPADKSVPLPESAMNPNVPIDSERLRQTLYHCHLPMLANLGFIEWETEPLVAVRGPEFEQVAVVFNALHTTATDIPDSLVIGCQQLEEKQQETQRE